MAKKETVLDVLKELRDIFKSGTQPVLPGPVARQINERYTDNGDGTVTDHEQKVVWVKNPTVLGPAFQKTMVYADAEKACKDLSFAGHKDWRLPTVQELRSIVDYGQHDPAWDPAVFSGKHDDYYWTSTPCAWNPVGAAWCVSSGSGNVFYNGRVNSYYVRPVRASQ